MTTRHKTTQTQQWFNDRIGKVIFRDNNCACAECQQNIDGIKIDNDVHAEYLYTIQQDFAGEGVYLNYRDTKEITI